MKPSVKPLALAAASLALLTATSHATVIFTDTFASGTGGWYQAGTVNTLANSGSGQLSWSSGNTGTTDRVRQVIGKSFTTQTIAVGQTIRITFDYTQNAATTNDILRVGFYNVANQIAADGWSMSGTTVAAFSGYYGFIRDNDFSNPNLIRTESATDTIAETTGPTVQVTAPTLGTISGTTTTYNIVQGTQYQVVFELTRTSLTQMSSLYKLSSGLTTHQLITGSTSIVQDDFDTVVLRSVGPTLFDNIQVSVIPEPRAALLGGLGLLALLRRRR